MNRSPFLAAAALVAALASAADACAQDLLKLAIGQRGKWDGAIPELGQRAGIFRKHGLNLEILWTSGGGETMQAVISASVDIGSSAGTLGVLAAYAKNAPVRIIGAQATGDDAFWYVRADSPIKGVQDFNGRTLAYSTNGSSTNANVLAMIDHYKISAKPVATGNAGATFTQVMSGQVDIGWSAPPFMLSPLVKGDIRVVTKSMDLPLVRGHSIRVNIANAGLLERKPDVFRRFNAAYRETIEWMYSTEEALKVYADFAEVSVEEARMIRKDFDPKEMVDTDRVSGLDNLMKDAVALKFITAPLNEAQLKELIQIK
jgi:NitT/TauT family transport system substrate-binding protein